MGRNLIDLMSINAISFYCGGPPFVWFQGSEVPSLTPRSGLFLLLVSVNQTRLTQVSFSASHFQAFLFSVRLFMKHFEWHICECEAYFDIVRKPTHQSPSCPWAVWRLQPGCQCGCLTRELSNKTLSFPSFCGKVQCCSVARRRH